MKRIAHGIILFCCLCSALWAEVKAPQLNLTESPTTIVISQRSTQALPDSKATLHLRLGDITMGQVSVSLYYYDAELFEFHYLIDHRSMKEGDSIEFSLPNQSRYRLTMVQLINQLLGEDVARIALNTLQTAPSIPEQL